MKMPILLCINLIPLIDPIIVLMKPVFLIHPINVSVTLDGVVRDITMTCAAEGSPKPVITWLENNSTIVNETGNTQNGTMMSILTFKIHKKGKMKNYRCLARNTVGVVLSKEAKITFLEKETTKVAGTFDLCDSRFPNISNEKKQQHLIK